MRFISQISIFLVLVFISSASSYGQINLSPEVITVLEEPADKMMSDYLTGLINKQFTARDSLLSTFVSAGDWDYRASTIKDSMISWTGLLPERTPLNARITGRLERDDYIVEKILFESRPDFLVSANLYLPKNFSLPCPAVLNVIGHSPTGKARDKVQRRSIAQAMKGFVALTIDAIGQGERQVNDYLTAGNPPGNAHVIIGEQAFISGTHLFNLMVWDAIRAIDYMVSRPEVDKDRICITGCSGGGMMTTYIMPFDSRISVSVPVCNPNTWSHRVHAGLGTDHEQVFFGAFRGLVDPRGDPLFCQIPKPMMINATTDDNLNPPRGVWELSSWLYKSYSAHGVPEKFTTTMVEAPHGYNLEQRELAYSWMLRWTGGEAADFWEGDIPIEEDNDLWATSSGNVYDEPDSRKPHELVMDYLQENRAEWRHVRSKDELKEHKRRMVDLAENVLFTDLDRINVAAELREKRYAGDVIVRHFVLRPEKGILLPGILLEPGEGRMDKGVILYVSRKGKSAILEEQETVKELLGEGYGICAVDLRGTGETSPDMSGTFWAFLAGKPLFGQRVGDVLATIKWLRESVDGSPDIKLWGSGMGALYAAFAGVYDGGVSGFLLEEPLISFESLAQAEIPGYRNEEIIIPGILERFDMPQVYQALCPNPVTVLNPYSGDKTPAGESDISQLDKLVSVTYRSTGKNGDWSVRNISKEQRNKTIINFFTGK